VRVCASKLVTVQVEVPDQGQDRARLLALGYAYKVHGV
jgi:hypothetical protein